MVVKDVKEIMTHDGAFKKLRSKINEIENFRVIDPVPEKNELVNRGET
ncbi:MAG: hypothetical protein CHKLHMKO_00385 [Candidatus Argoarchaeum ethanivorans]|uniref:Uncharacterized protein n=1 Tax=Candidatus Argoarchaeum ethanivorans TaxID=2608793 RepID=A0A811TB28_9EURY|nr:MAG: hypothetical protein CHKLHMKO_00385 [Candidatus Argoarchaeum ethanivorans]